MTEHNFNTYDFIVNEDDEIMLLIYARQTVPQTPVLELNLDEQTAFLYRSENDGIALSDISEDILDSLCDYDKILDVIDVIKQEGDVDLLNGNANASGCKSSVGASGIALFALFISTLCIVKKGRENK